MSFNICNLVPESCSDRAPTNLDVKLEKMDIAHDVTLPLPPSQNIKLLEELKRWQQSKHSSRAPPLPSSPPSLRPSPMVAASPVGPPFPVVSPQTVLFCLMQQQQMLANARVNLAQMVAGGPLAFRRFGQCPTPIVPFPPAIPNARSMPSIHRTRRASPVDSLKADSTFVPPNSMTIREYRRSNAKRTYYCQRCLNHGMRFKRKDHKNECQYQRCSCDDCIMVDKRRDLNKKLHKLEEGDSRGGRERQTTPAGSVDGTDRKPNCQKCFQHGMTVRLKNHKRVCPFKNCPCEKCLVVQERQKLMADQIKLRRKQKKDKEAREAMHNMDTTAFSSEAFMGMTHHHLPPMLTTVDCTTTTTMTNEGLSPQSQTSSELLNTQHVYTTRL